MAAAVAAQEDAASAAVRFLEKVRDRQVKLEPGADSAISAQTSERKRAQIGRRLERLAADLKGGKLEPGTERMDGELAAVVVRRTGMIDPQDLRVFPVALVNRGGKWLAAPVPASFENAGTGYDPAVRARVAALEEWMLRAQTIELEKAREEMVVRVRQEIERALPIDLLRRLNAREVFADFLKACRNRDLPRMLGFLGGLSKRLPDDWGQRSRVAGAAAAGSESAPMMWRMLMAPEILRVVVFQEADSELGSFALACLDPDPDPERPRPPQIKLVHFETTRTEEGFWRVDPPQALLQPNQAAETIDGDLDSGLLSSFGAKAALEYPPSPHPTAEKAHDALIDALHSDDPSRWAGLVANGMQAATAAWLGAAQLWWDLKSPVAARVAVPLALHEADGQAVAACQYFNARNPDRFDLRFLYFTNGETGWLWDPIPPAKVRDIFAEWTERQTTEWRKSWMEPLLRHCVVLQSLPETGAPSEAEARKVVETWLRAIHAGDVDAALRATARLDTVQSKTTLLRNLGYEITGAHRIEIAPVVTGVHRGDRWAAVGAKVDPQPDGKPFYPLYPVVVTPQGPRILMEIDLVASNARGRMFLNKSSLERLRKISPEASTELKQLLSTHQSESAH